ncbi:hypothetical protein [Burkholderia ubonensis]|uniref:hypothetical protein n=1 Tax=Burkholderia ubonensis TaxID=101571 RepID=UPI0012FC0EB4|nr:hypothetical protein [Burkholderia ubonensis]
MIYLLEFAAVWERALFVALAATNAWGVPGSAHVRTDVVQPHENKQHLIWLPPFHMTRRAGLKNHDVWFSQTISPRLFLLTQQEKGVAPAARFL